MSEQQLDVYFEIDKKRESDINDLVRTLSSKDEAGINSMLNNLSCRLKYLSHKEDAIFSMRVSNGLKNITISTGSSTHYKYFDEFIYMLVKMGTQNIRAEYFDSSSGGEDEWRIETEADAKEFIKRIEESQIEIEEPPIELDFLKGKHILIAGDLGEGADSEELGVFFLEEMGALIAEEFNSEVDLVLQGEEADQNILKKAKSSGVPVEDFHSFVKTTFRKVSGDTFYDLYIEDEW